MNQQQTAEVISARFNQMAAFSPGAEDWNAELNKLFKEYVDLRFGEDSEAQKKDEELIKYFTEVVNENKVVARRTEEGVFMVDGLEGIL